MSETEKLIDEIRRKAQKELSVLIELTRITDRKHQRLFEMQNQQAVLVQDLDRSEDMLTHLYGMVESGRLLALKPVPYLGGMALGLWFPAPRIICLDVKWNQTLMKQHEPLVLLPLPFSPDITIWRAADWPSLVNYPHPTIHGGSPCWGQTKTDSGEAVSVYNLLDKYIKNTDATSLVDLLERYLAQVKGSSGAGSNRRIQSAEDKLPWPRQQDNQELIDAKKEKRQGREKVPHARPQVIGPNDGAAEAADGPRRIEWQYNPPPIQGAEATTTNRVTFQEPPREWGGTGASISTEPINPFRTWPAGVDPATPASAEDPAGQELQGTDTDRGLGNDDVRGPEGETPDGGGG